VPHANLQFDIDLSNGLSDVKREDMIHRSTLMEWPMHLGLVSKNLLVRNAHLQPTSSISVNGPYTLFYMYAFCDIPHGVP
jgi:hypothetical protein